LSFADKILMKNRGNVKHVCLSDAMDRI